MLKHGIFKCISWLNILFFVGDDRGSLKEGVRTFQMAPTPPLNSPIFFCLHIYSLYEFQWMKKIVGTTKCKRIIRNMQNLVNRVFFIVISSQADSCEARLAALAVPLQGVVRAKRCLRAFAEGPRRVRVPLHPGKSSFPRTSTFFLRAFVIYKLYDWLLLGITSNFCDESSSRLASGCLLS